MCGTPADGDRPLWGDYSMHYYWGDDGSLPIALQRHQKKIPEQLKVIRYSRNIVANLVYGHINIVDNFVK